MNMLDGLYLYEVVMLVLGVALFLVLLIAFAVQIFRGYAYGKLLSFFVLPILMVGYPSIESIEFSDGVIKIAKMTHALEEDPTNSVLRTQLANNVEAVSGRIVTKSNTTIRLARAEFALGDSVAAEERINTLLQKSPRQPAALKLKEQLTLDRNLAVLADHVEKNPQDNEAKSRLSDTVSKVVVMKSASPETITNIARAQAALDEEEKARENVDKALAINPNLTPAINLRSKLLRR